MCSLWGVPPKFSSKKKSLDLQASMRILMKGRFSLNSEPGKCLNTCLTLLSSGLSIKTTTLQSSSLAKQLLLMMAVIKFKWDIWASQRIVKSPHLHGKNTQNWALALKKGKIYNRWVILISENTLSFQRLNFTNHEKTVDWNQFT